MTEEEAQQIRQLIREETNRIAEIQAADEVRIGRLEETAKTLLSISQNLVQLAQRHDERMDSLVRTVERFVQARGSNGDGNRTGGLSRRVRRV